MPTRRHLLKTIALAAPVLAQTLPPNTTRPWIGPDFWANPLQDWQLHDGHIECIVSGGDRSVALLTQEILPTPGSLLLEVELGPLQPDLKMEEGWAGLRIGTRGNFSDYRDDAIFGRGVNCGVTTDGRLFIADLSASAPTLDPSKPIRLRLTSEPGTLTITAFDPTGPVLSEYKRERVPADWLPGLVALVCSHGPVRRSPERSTAADFGFAARPHTERGGNVRYWFKNLKVSGSQVAPRPERAWGPLLFNQFTLSNKTLKMTVQLAPLNSDRDTPKSTVELHANGKQLGSALVEPASATATFRLPWDPSKDVPYELRFGPARLSGVIPHDPLDKPKLTLGALTCQGDYGYPHTPIFENLRTLRPDILFFTGDQIYERNADYGVQRFPAPAARLDYLRKWFLFGWAWGELTRSIPCVCLPDDHDVYHGNIWGAAGRKAEGQGQPGQDSGGYTMPAPWVNIVQRTQASHLPDPPEKTPIEQGISVHYSHLVWGGISFALLEDRKWKSAPKTFLPDAKIVNGFPQNPNWKGLDAPAAELLGPRQEQFLANWALDWSNGIWLKCAVSATIFATVATLPAPARTDSVTSKLPVLKPGEYGEGEVPTMDHDSNGWPQHARTKALRLLRQASAFHIAGDQHLGSTFQYGIDDWNDGPFAICTPAISNIFPRRWFPPKPGRNPLPHSPRNTGEFTDGFGNRLTIHAVANPMQFGVLPTALNNRAPGFGSVEITRADHKIVLTNWPRWASIAKGDKPYPGWPVTVTDLPKSAYVLQTLTARTRCVAEVLDDENKVLYSLRLTGNQFAAPVPGPGEYTVRFHDPASRYEEFHRRLEAKTAN